MTVHIAKLYQRQRTWRARGGLLSPPLLVRGPPRSATKPVSLMDTVVPLPYESLASAWQATLDEFFNIMITTCICITIMVIKIPNLGHLSIMDKLAFPNGVRYREVPLYTYPSCRNDTYTLVHISICSQWRSQYHSQPCLWCIVWRWLRRGHFHVYYLQRQRQHVKSGWARCSFRSGGVIWHSFWIHPA